MKDKVTSIEKRVVKLLEELIQVIREKEILVKLVQEAPPEEELPEFTEEPPKPLCSRCGHEKETHEPLDQNGCFPHGGCSCRGWK